MTLPPPIITQSVGENWQRWQFIIHDKLYNSGLCRVSDPVPRCPLRSNMIITLSHYYHATLCTLGVNNNTPIPQRPVIIAYLDKMHVIPLLWHKLHGLFRGWLGFRNTAICVTFNWMSWQSELYNSATISPYSFQFVITRRHLFTSVTDVLCSFRIIIKLGLSSSSSFLFIVLAIALYLAFSSLLNLNWCGSFSLTVEITWSIQSQNWIDRAWHYWK